MLEDKARKLGRRQIRAARACQQKLLGLIQQEQALVRAGDDDNSGVGTRGIEADRELTLSDNPHTRTPTLRAARGLSCRLGLSSREGS